MRNLDIVAAALVIIGAVNWAGRRLPLGPSGAASAYDSVRPRPSPRLSTAWIGLAGLYQA
jgi:hypothetical protein